MERHVTLLVFATRPIIQEDFRKYLLLFSLLLTLRLDKVPHRNSVYARFIFCHTLRHRPCETEVAYLDLAVGVKQDVGGLNVSVHDIAKMDKLDSH